LEILDPHKKYFSIYSGLCNMMLGYTDLAQVDFDSARIFYEKRIVNNPKHPAHHMFRGIALSGLGRCDEAIIEGQLGVKLLPTEDDIYNSTRQLYFMAIIYTHCEMQEEALDILEDLLANPSYVNLITLEVEPFLDKLRDLPRYKAIIARGETVF